MASTLSDVDLEIIKTLYGLKSGKTITTYSLGKKIFNGRKIKNKSRFYTDKANYIDYRMQRLGVIGIISISKVDGRNVYTLIANNVRKRKKLVKVEELRLKVNGKWESFIRKF